MTLNALSFNAVAPEAAAVDFIAAMGKCVSGVTVVTTDGPGGRFGLTVSAMSSVSAEPPLLLVCINRNNLACSAIDRNGCFAVNVLTGAQQQIAQVFAGQLPVAGGDRFACASWMEQHTGAPVLGQALASFDCYLEQQINLGSHAVFVGRVAQAQSAEGSALAYSQRIFGTLNADANAK
ncbi:flavin reductase family protein [Pseudomonas sp. M30-35]|uniref:flavin reductase family protein n=1 Tax=Pseudomonas sp. M30-35 TaxID=1981174 RepID=UPI000B3C685E|nr:flavin reductase family protein [Pseudomonas sp. M30-35]ARU86753.1 hypothetical protein B9K09_01560 [Pseudomonas sp. M30-35]